MHASISIKVKVQKRNPCTKTSINGFYYCMKFRYKKNKNLDSGNSNRDVRVMLTSTRHTIGQWVWMLLQQSFTKTC